MSPLDIAYILNGALSDLYLTKFKVCIERIDCIGRAPTPEGDKLSRLSNLMFNTQAGNSVPKS